MQYTKSVQTGKKTQKQYKFYFNDTTTPTNNNNKLYDFKQSVLNRLTKALAHTQVQQNVMRTVRNKQQYTSASVLDD